MKTAFQIIAGWTSALALAATLAAPVGAAPVVAGTITIADLPFFAGGLPNAVTNQAPNGSRWNLDLTGFATPFVELTIDVGDNFPSSPDDFDVFFDTNFLFNSFDTASGATCVNGNPGASDAACVGAVTSRGAFTLTVARDVLHTIDVNLANWYGAATPTQDTWYDINITAAPSNATGPNPVFNGTAPEPATLALVGVALAGLGWSRRKKAR